VLTAWAPPAVYLVNPLDNKPVVWTGAFTVAAIGAFPATAVGGTYALTATVTLSDTRVLQVSSTVLCIANALHA
jgi:hypothetical protein